MLNIAKPVVNIWHKAA